MIHTVWLKGYSLVGEKIKTQNFNIYNINEVIIIAKKCIVFSTTELTNCFEENKVPSTLFEERKDGRV